MVVRPPDPPVCPAMPRATSKGLDGVKNDVSEERVEPICLWQCAVADFHVGGTRASIEMQRFPILSPSAARLGDPRLRPAHAVVRTRAECSGCMNCCVGSPGGFSAGAVGDDVGGHWRTVRMLPARTLAC
jgi:hypothetical protein